MFVSDMTCGVNSFGSHVLWAGVMNAGDFVNRERGRGGEGGSHARSFYTDRSHAEKEVKEDYAVEQGGV